MLIGETFHQEGKLSTYRLYTYKGHVCRGSAEGYPIHLQREPSRDCEESVKKNNQMYVVNFRNVYFLCFVNIICSIIGKKLAFGQFSNWFLLCPWFCKDECSYDVHKFNYSSQKRFLISCALKWESFSGYCIWICVRIKGRRRQIFTNFWPLPPQPLAIF